MTRHHMTADGPIPFTPEEEAKRDAEEAAWLAKRDVEKHNKPLLADILAAEEATGFTRRQREYLLAHLADASLKGRLQMVETVIAAKRAELRNDPG